MTSQELFWICAIVAAVLSLSFVLGKKGYMRPSPLDLRKGNKTNQPAKTTGIVKAQGNVIHFKTQTPEERAEGKSLNVIFMFNGHNFDAFEVLGLPAGAKPEAVRKAYELMKKQTTKDSLEFIEAAYHAILKDREPQK
ncbi:MAG: hypothetical protein ACK5RO_10035 [Pseudobdellovibrionaceae bacterium]|jgi:hypothetical protein